MTKLDRYQLRGALGGGRVNHFIKVLFSPISLVLVAVHFVIVIIWYLLFYTEESSEIAVWKFVFVIDIVPVVALNGLIERLVSNLQYPVRSYFIVMGFLGSIQWCCVGAAITSGWEWLTRNRA